MSILDWFKHKGAKALDTAIPNSYPNSFDLGLSSASGVDVSVSRAIQQSTVLQCVTILANGVSQIPFRLMKEGKKDADTHPLYWLFKEKPNRWQSSYEFWQTVMLNLALQGECVVWVIRVRGEIKELIPFPPGSFMVNERYEGGWAKYIYTLTKDDGSSVTVDEKDIWHLRWREFGVRVGLGQMDIAREVVGLAMAADGFVGSSLKNGAVLHGILSAKSQLNPQQRELLQKEWSSQYSGSNNANRTAVLGADLEYKPISQTNSDTKIVDIRKAQIEEICRCWNVNPHMVFFYENTSSYSSSEQMMLQHVVHTMAPWYRMLEESAYVNLLTEKERRIDKLYFAFNDNALLRADTEGRSNYYHKLFNIGAITPNEIRALEDMPPMEGGDKLYVQGAIVPLEDAGKWNNDAAASNSVDDAESDDDGGQASDKDKEVSDD